MTRSDFDAPALLNRLYSILQDVCDEADDFARNTPNNNGGLALVLECRKAVKIANQEVVPYLKANGFRWDGQGFSRSHS